MSFEEDPFYISMICAFCPFTGFLSLSIPSSNFPQLWDPVAFRSAQVFKIVGMRDEMHCLLAIYSGLGASSTHFRV